MILCFGWVDSSQILMEIPSTQGSIQSKNNSFYSGILDLQMCEDDIFLVPV